MNFSPAFCWKKTGLLFAFVGAVSVSVPSFAAEPVMDTVTYGVYRAEPVNQAREGRFQEAILSEEKALKIAQDRLGPVHPSLALILNDLGSLYCDTADYEKAEEEYKWGLALREKTLGPMDLTVADSEDRLAALYNDLGRFQEAEILEKKALALREKNSPKDPSSLARTLGLMARIEMNLHASAPAQTLLEKALEAQAQNPKAEAGLTIHLLNSLAEAYRLNGFFPKSEAALQEALQKAIKDFAADKTWEADAEENLADFYHSQGQEEKAKPLYESALQIAKPYVGNYDGYPALPAMKRLAKDEAGAGDLPAAEALWAKTLKAEETVWQAPHPQTAMDLMNWARVESVLGEKETAKNHLRQASEILKTLFPDGHPLLDQAKTLLEKVK